MFKAGWYRKGDYVKIDGQVYRIRYCESDGQTVTWTLRSWPDGVESKVSYEYSEKVEKAL